MSIAPPLVGEPLALDLVNTLLAGPDGEIDLLSSVERFRPWLDAQAGRIVPLADPAAVDLAALRALRAHVASAVERAREGRPPSAAALEALVAAQRAAPGYRGVEWDGRSLWAVRRREGGPGAGLLADLADAAVDLLT